MRLAVHDSGLRKGDRDGRRRRVGLAACLLTIALAGTSAASAPAGAAPATPVPATDPTALVNPFVGTENFGNTFPGAAAPFGMVQVSPDTGGQGGYDYQQNSIYGFSQTHLSGVGCGVGGEVPIMPTTGAVSTDPAAYRSAYSHDDEQADTRVLPGRPVPVRRQCGTDRDPAHRLAALHVPGHRDGERPVQHRQSQHGRTRLRDARRRRPYGRGPGTRGRLLRRARPAHRLLQRLVRPAVQLVRDVARVSHRAGQPGRRRHRRQRRMGQLRRHHRPGRRGQGRPVVHRRRRRAPQPGRGDRRLVRLRRRPREAARPVDTPARQRAGRRAAAPTGSARSSPPCTTPNCTRTWPATWTAAYTGFDGKAAHRKRLHAVPELVAVGHAPAAEPAAGAAATAGRPGRGAVGSGHRAGGRVAAALGAGQQRNQHHDRRPGDAVPRRGVVEGSARRARARGVRAAQGQRDQPAAGRFAVQRPRRRRRTTTSAGTSRPACGSASTARTRAATTTARTRRRRRWSTRPPTRRCP